MEKTHEEVHWCSRSCRGACGGYWYGFLTIIDQPAAEDGDIVLPAVAAAQAGGGGDLLAELVEVLGLLLLRHPGNPAAALGGGPVGKEKHHVPQPQGHVAALEADPAEDTGGEGAGVDFQGAAVGAAPAL